MVSNKYHRDFNSYGALKRPGRMDRILFQDIADCGDGFGGVQWMMLKAFGTLLFPRFVIEGCEYNGVDTMSNGYIMRSGVPIEVDEQAIVVANGEFLYINENGVALTTAVQATAQAEAMVYERDALAVGYDIRFRLIDNVLKVFGLDAQYLRIHHDVIIDEDVEIGGDLDMTDGEITDIKQIDGGGDPIIVDDEFNMNAHQISGLANPTALQDAVTLAYLRNMFMPVGAIIMYNGVGWVDNVTMVGWYECTLANVAQGVPDLIDKFIRASAASGAGGGADSVMLAANQIPTHTTGGRSATHTHSGTTGNNSVAHNHTNRVGNQSASHNPVVSGGAHMHEIEVWDSIFRDAAHAYPSKADVYKGKVDTETDGAHVHTVGNQSASHNHTVTVNNSTTNHTHAITTGNDSVDHTHTYTNAGQIVVPTMPVYYKLRFVMRTV